MVLLFIFAVGWSFENNFSIALHSKKRQSLLLFLYQSGDLNL